MKEAGAMDRAIELAARGWGQVAPNPLVGAVLLRGDSVIGEGFHAQYGGLHAEMAALAACDDARGATCVVNLEPCAHHGKTPPCADALIQAGIARVVIAQPDPNPVAQGGVATLRAAGIEVEIGRGREAAAALNAPFLWATRRANRPFVALKLATSLDGFIADHAGGSQWISGPAARDYAHWLRAGFDAVGVGRLTAETDNPRLTARGSTVPRVAPTRVVFSRRGRVPPELGLVATARDTPVVVVCHPEAAGRAESELAASGVRVLRAGTLPDAMAGLREAGITSILIEGGAGLGSALWVHGLVDRVYWIQAPLWLGDGIRAFRAPRISLAEAQAWPVTERRPLGPDTLLVIDRELCLQGS